MDVAPPSKLFHAIVVMGAAFGAACSTEQGASSSAADSRAADVEAGEEAAKEDSTGDASSLDFGAPDTVDPCSEAGSGDADPCCAPDAEGTACHGDGGSHCGADAGVCIHGACAWPCFV